jgi:CheY-like chemotaxis protein
MWVEASGGVLHIKSAKNQGTAAEIIIPYHPFDPITYNYKEFSTLEHACNVLLVEDDLLLQMVTAKAVRRWGHHVDIASTGAEAAKLALNNNYDVVLLDISLPDMNGLDVMRLVIEKKQYQMIFIALTSHIAKESRAHFISQGVMEVVTKPFDPLLLRQLIQDAYAVKKRYLLNPNT